MPNVSNSNYAPVSEASDDMYAAIEDPTYIPTGKKFKKIQHFKTNQFISRKFLENSRLNRVWKFLHISVTKILREINFWQFRTLKPAILAVLEASGL